MRAHFKLFLLIIVLCFTAPATWSADIFDAHKEFPNYFLPEQYRETKAEKVPTEVVQKISSEIEQTLHSVFERVTLPILNEHTAQVTQTRIIPLMMKEAAAIDPDLEVHIAGGVLRSAYAYLYREIYMGMQEHPPITAQETLVKIRAGKDDLPALRVLGIGSDFDVLLDGANPKAQDQASKKIKGIIDATAKHFGITNLGDVDARLMVGVGDVKPYAAQTERASSQGGSAIDWMTFDTKTSRIRTPARDPKVFNNLILGVYEFHTPITGSLGDATLVRGFRPLTEIPYLTLTPQSDIFLKKEISKRINSGVQLERNAMKQFPKLVRNSFPAAANNRLLRARADSSEASFLSLANSLKHTDPATSGQLLPQFVGYRRITDNGQANTIPEHLLTSVKKFNEVHTKGGVFYHGTPSFDAAVSILRQGLILSGEGQGHAFYGTGGYATSDFAAAGNAGEAVIPLELDATKPIRVLDWEKIKDDPWIKTLEKKSQKSGIELFPILAKEYGVDVIVNKYILIENFAALRPVPVSALLKNARDGLLVSSSSTQQLLERFDSYRKLQQLVQLTDGKDLSSDLPVEIIQSLKAAMLRCEQSDWDLKAKIMDMYAEVFKAHPNGDVPSPSNFFKEVLTDKLTVPLLTAIPPVDRLDELLRERISPVPISPESLQVFHAMGVDADIMKQYNTQLKLYLPKLDPVLEKMLKKYVPDRAVKLANTYQKTGMVFSNALELFGNDPKMVSLLMQRPSEESGALSHFFATQPNLFSDPELFSLFKKFVKDTGGLSSFLFQEIVNRPDAKDSKLLCDYLRSSEFKELVNAHKPWIENHSRGWRPSAIGAADDWISKLIKKAKFDKQILAEAPAVAEVMPKTYTEKTRILNGGTKVEFFEEPKWYDSGDGKWSDSGLELPAAGKSYRRAELDELGNLYVELNGDGDQFLIKQLNTGEMIPPERIHYSAAVGTVGPKGLKHIYANPSGKGVIGLDTQGKIWSIVDQDGNTETYLAKEIPRSGTVKEMSRSTSGEIVLHQQNGKKYLLGHDEHGPAMTMDSPKCEQFFIKLYKHTGR